MKPRIDGEHHEEDHLLHDLQYEIIDGVPVLIQGKP